MKWYWWLLIAVLVIGAGVVTYKVIQKRKELQGSNSNGSTTTLTRPQTVTTAMSSPESEVK